MPIRFQSIEWPDPGYANLVTFEYPGHQPKPSSPWIGEKADAPSGYIDTWEEAVHQELDIVFRRIPPQDKAGATGYHGVSGVNAFFLYAKAGGLFRLNLNRDDTPTTTHTCQLVDGNFDRESDKAQNYQLTLKVRDVNGAEFVVGV